MVSLTFALEAVLEEFGVHLGERHEFLVCALARAAQSQWWSYHEVASYLDIPVRSVGKLARENKLSPHIPAVDVVSVQAAMEQVDELEEPFWPLVDEPPFELSAEERARVVALIAGLDLLTDSSDARSAEQERAVTRPPTGASPRTSASVAPRRTRVEKEIEVDSPEWQALWA